MIQKKTYTVFIDTKIDKLQNSSKFKIKLNNWFMRSNIKMNDNSVNEWFISIKSLALLNFLVIYPKISMILLYDLILFLFYQNLIINFA